MKPARILCLLLAAAPSGAAGQATQALEPATLEPPAMGGGRVSVVRIRFYADDDYRAGLFRWAERVRAQLSFINRFVEPGFGVRFEAESFRRWHRSSKTGDVHQILPELEAHDGGQGVDWVVGFVTPMPLVNNSIHEIGAARVLGRHFVLRGMASVEEAGNLGKDLGAEQGLSLYGRRKWHKECVIFLHEWLHTLGAMHAIEPQRIMHPAYSNRMRNVSSEDAQLVVTALKARFGARGGAPPDWSELRGFIERTTSAEWSGKEREELLAALVKSGARLGPAPAPAGVARAELSAEDSERFTRAVGLVKAGKGVEAWPVAQALAAKHPSRLDVQRVLCRLSYLPAAGDEGTAACKRARELAPGDPDPVIDQAQAHLQRRQTREALALVAEADEQARKLPKERSESLIWVARLWGQLGALTRAEEAIERAAGAASPSDVAEVRAAIARDRMAIGLPRSSDKFSLPAEREPAYAERVRTASDLLASRKRAEARALLAEALREFPGAPGLEVVACELELRERRPQQAEPICRRALAVFEELPRAHYLLGHCHLSAGRRDAAVAAFRRSIELDPKDAGAWETLADVYRMSGKRQELTRLRADYEKAFSKPMR